MLEDVTSHEPAPDRQPFVVINALALLSLLTGEDGDDERAMAFARQVMDVAEAQGARYDPMTGVAYIALARATARRAVWPRPSSCSTRDSRCWATTATRSSTRRRWSSWPASATPAATPTGPAPRSGRRAV